MKRLLAVLLACLCLLPLSGCNESMSTAGEGSDGGDRFTKNPLIACTIITDEATGVQYLYAYYADGAGMTVLLDSDGKPFVRKVN